MRSKFFLVREEVERRYQSTGEGEGSWSSRKQKLKDTSAFHHSITPTYKLRHIVL